MRLSRRALNRHLLAVLATAASAPSLAPNRAAAQSLNYGLRPEPVGDGIWLLRGLDEHLSPQNGGNIANTVFMTTGEGVVVFDTGPSGTYGEQLKHAIQLTTDEPIRQIIVSHAHPDHYLGNQAFADLPIFGLQATIDTIAQIGEAFTDNMYRLVDYWMKGTRTTPPNLAIGPGPIRIGNRNLEILALDGHTQGDLALFDHTSNMLIAGDLVFMNRAPTTPQAELPRWQSALDTLQELPIKTLIPGHGPATEGARAIEQTRGYLRWLDTKLRDAAESGMAAAEVMTLQVDAEVADLAVVEEEFVRSVSHLYGGFQLEALERIN